MATIYSITSDKGNKVYIGSTTASLNDRKRQHKYDSKRNDCIRGSKILIEEYGWENCIFAILEECTLEQRYERERWYIENIPNTVNKRIPGRTDKEYREENSEKEKERNKAYYEANKERKKAYRESKKQSVVILT